MAGSVRALLPDPGPLDDAALAGAMSWPDTERPWLRASMVTGLDGAISGADGRSGSLSTPADRAVFALCRALCDVVLVGWGTARAEGYRPATVGERWAPWRPADAPATPRIAVVSAGLDIDPALPLIASGGGSTVILTTTDSDPSARARLAEHVEVLMAGEGRVDLGRAVHLLAERDWRRVHCEGGPRLLAQLLDAGLVDELSLTLAPILPNGAGPRLLGPDGLAAPHQLRLVRLMEDSGYLFAGYRPERGLTPQEGR